MRAGLIMMRMVHMPRNTHSGYHVRRSSAYQICKKSKFEVTAIKREDLGKPMGVSATCLALFFGFGLFFISLPMLIVSCLIDIGIHSIYASTYYLLFGVLLCIFGFVNLCEVGFPHFQIFIMQMTNYLQLINIAFNLVWLALIIWELVKIEDYKEITGFVLLIIFLFFSVSTFFMISTCSDMVNTKHPEVIYALRKKHSPADKRKLFGILFFFQKLAVVNGYDEDLNSAAKCLSKSSVIRELVIQKCYFSEMMFKAIHNFLGTPLQRLKIKNVELNSKHFEILVDGLKRNSSLEEIVIRRNQFTISGKLGIFLDELKNCPNLESLDIGKNHLWEQALQEIATIARHRELLKLSLTNDDLNLQSINSLVDILQACPRIKELDLSRNKLGSEGLKIILNALMKNSLLECVNLSSNSPDQDTGTELSLLIFHLFFLSRVIYSNNLLNDQSIKTIIDTAFDKRSALQVSVTKNTNQDISKFIELINEKSLSNPGIVFNLSQKVYVCFCMVISLNFLFINLI